MSSPAAPPRRRRWPWILLGLLLLLLAAAASLPWWFDARRVAALVLDAAGDATGLHWRIDGEPRLRWRPDPWLSLPGLQVGTPQGAIVLQAEALQIALPWSTLRGETRRVDAIELDAPRIDSGALADWLATQPPTAPFALPELMRLQIDDGEWRHGDLHFARLDLTIEGLGTTEPTVVVGGGRIDSLDGAPGFNLILSARMGGDSATLSLDDLDLRLRGDPPLPALRATGALALGPRWQFALDAEIERWLVDWGSLPAPLDRHEGPIALRVTQDGDGPRGAMTTLAITAGDAKAEARGTPADVLAWTDDENRGVLPPAGGRVRLPALDVEGVRMEGIELDIDDGAPSP